MPLPLSNHSHARSVSGAGDQVDKATASYVAPPHHHFLSLIDTSPTGDGGAADTPVSHHTSPPPCGRSAGHQSHASRRCVTGAGPSDASLLPASPSGTPRTPFGFGGGGGTPQTPNDEGAPRRRDEGSRAVTARLADHTRTASPAFVGSPAPPAARRGSTPDLTGALSPGGLAAMRRPSVVSSPGSTVGALGGAGEGLHLTKRR